MEHRGGQREAVVQGKLTGNLAWSASQRLTCPVTLHKPWKLFFPSTN